MAEQISVLEDEDHVLHKCPLGAKKRSHFYSKMGLIPGCTLSPFFNVASTYPDSHISRPSGQL